MIIPEEEMGGLLVEAEQARTGYNNGFVLLTPEYTVALMDKIRKTDLTNEQIESLVIDYGNDWNDGMYGNGRLAIEYLLRTVIFETLRLQGIVPS